MTYESSAETLSIHRTREGAEASIEKHQVKDRKEFDERHKKQVEEYGGTEAVCLIDNEYPKEWQWWGVQEQLLVD